MKRYTVELWKLEQTNLARTWRAVDPDHWLGLGEIVERRDQGKTRHSHTSSELGRLETIGWVDVKEERVPVVHTLQSGAKVDRNEIRKFYRQRRTQRPGVEQEDRRQNYGKRLPQQPSNAKRKSRDKMSSTQLKLWITARMREAEEARRSLDQTTMAHALLDLVKELRQLKDRV